MDTCFNCRHRKTIEDRKTTRDDPVFRCEKKNEPIDTATYTLSMCDNWEKEIETDFTQELVCPYCGYEDTDSWEYDQNTFDGVLGDIECGECGKTFHAQRNGEITYSTWIDKETKKET